MTNSAFHVIYLSTRRERSRKKIHVLNKRPRIVRTSLTQKKTAYEQEMLSYSSILHRRALSNKNSRTGNFAEEKEEGRRPKPMLRPAFLLLCFGAHRKLSIGGDRIASAGLACDITRKMRLPTRTQSNASSRNAIN